MGAHLIDGEFQSDKYPTCPRGKVPLSCKDPTAQDLLWEYAYRRRSVDAEFSADLEEALTLAGYKPVKNSDTNALLVEALAHNSRLLGRIAILETALKEILALSADRERFVMQGPRGFAAAEQIARRALGEKL